MIRATAVSTILAALAGPAFAQEPMRAELSCRPTGTPFEHCCLVELTRSGEPVPDAEFSVKAEMPEMPMAHNFPPVPARAAGEPGRYAVLLPLEMDGDWLLRLELTEPRRDVVVLRHAFGPAQEADGTGHAGHGTVEEAGEAPDAGPDRRDEALAALCEPPGR